jgi:hypothetical protein
MRGQLIMSLPVSIAWPPQTVNGIHTFGLHTVLAACGTALLIESTQHVCQSLHQCAQVSTLVMSLPPLVERVAELEGRLTRSLTVAKQGLDILADQLVALGALNGRSSPNKNPLAGMAVLRSCKQ